MPRTASVEAGLAANRRLTEHYIAHDPTTIVLIPHTKVVTSGSYNYVPQPPRPAQDFKLLALINNWNGITSTEGGQVQEWSYILVGKYDAEIEIGDTWSDGKTAYRVEAILQASDFEVRAACAAYGSDPNYG